VNQLQLLLNGRLVAVTNAIPNVSGKQSESYDTIDYRANFPWDTATDTNGPQRVTLRALDNAGNSGDLNFDVFVSNPVVQMASPSFLSSRAGESISLTYHWSGGPLRAPAQVTTEFMSETTRRAAF